MSVRIESDGHTSRVLVDGKDISDHVTGVTFEGAPGLCTAVVELLPVEMCVDLPSEAVRLVHAPTPRRTIRAGGEPGGVTYTAWPDRPS